MNGLEERRGTESAENLFHSFSQTVMGGRTAEGLGEISLDHWRFFNRGKKEGYLSEEEGRNDRLRERLPL